LPVVGEHVVKYLLVLFNIGNDLVWRQKWGATVSPMPPPLIPATAVLNVSAHYICPSPHRDQHNAERFINNNTEILTTTNVYDDTILRAPET